MLSSLREEADGKLQMLLLPRNNGLTSLFKEVRVFKAAGLELRDTDGVAVLFSPECLSTTLELVVLQS